MEWDTYGMGMGYVWNGNGIRMEWEWDTYGMGMGYVYLAHCKD